MEFLANAVHTVDLGKAPVSVGALAAEVLIFLFTSLAIKAVGQAAGGMIAEDRRQFKDDPEILAGACKPDYAKDIDISAQAALRAMIPPGLLGLPWQLSSALPLDQKQLWAC